MIDIKELNSENLTAILKDKWLDYCQQNLSYIGEVKQITYLRSGANNIVPTNAVFILEVISVLAPDLANLIPIREQIKQEQNQAG